MPYLLMFIGGLSLISGNLIWIGHGIYELVTTEQGFFTVVLSNGLYWLIQMVVGVVSLFSGFIMPTSTKTKKRK